MLWPFKIQSVYLILITMLPFTNEAGKRLPFQRRSIDIFWRLFSTDRRIFVHSFIRSHVLGDLLCSWVSTYMNLYVYKYCMYICLYVYVRDCVIVISIPLATNTHIYVCVHVRLCVYVKISDEHISTRTIWIKTKW